MIGEKRELVLAVGVARLDMSLVANAAEIEAAAMERGGDTEAGAAAD